MNQIERILCLVNMLILTVICTASVFQAQNTFTAIVFLAFEWVSLILAGVWMIDILAHHTEKRAA